VNPAGTKALFSETSGGNILLWVKDFSNGTEKLLELKTLPEKCAWSPTEEDVVYCGAPDFYVRGAYPTNWYQGRFSFDDNIWRIETTQERYVLLVDTRENEDTFDVWKPQVSPNGKFFTFFNKRDLTLWSLDVSSESAVVAPESGAAGAAVATGTPAA
jgi:Tol biopolymer transport system component